MTTVTLSAGGLYHAAQVRWCSNGLHLEGCQCCLVNESLPHWKTMEQPQHQASISTSSGQVVLGMLGLDNSPHKKALQYGQVWIRRYSIQYERAPLWVRSAVLG